MRFSLTWLSDYVDLPEDAGVLAERLTAAGLAVEGVETVGEDTVFDIDVTTNRPDCMNHLGLAREVAALFDRPLRLPQAEPTIAETAPGLVTIEAPKLCRRYVGVVLTGVQVGPSPQWLSQRLEAIGQRPINNVVDVTNFVLWETGQPLHAFDLATLSGGGVVVRRARPGERLTTLDDEKRALTEEMLVIADGERPVALAGVMGGAATEVTSATCEVLLESAWFDPISVRRTARGLGMHTDASHRFERGTDPEACSWAAQRAVALLLQVGAVEAVSRLADAAGEALAAPPPVTLEGARLDRFAGAELPAEEVCRSLEVLGFGVVEQGENLWQVTPPSWRRFDISETADLYEEVLRHYGYERIPSSVPSVAGPDAPELPSHRLRREVAHRLAACGYAEAINYAFYSAEEDGQFAPLSGDAPALSLENPLSERYALMRRSLLPGVLASAHFNRRRSAPAVRLFELGHVFWRSLQGEPEEREHLVIVAGGALGTPWERRQELDLFDLKGVVESLAALFGVVPEVRPDAVPGMVAGSGGRWVIAGTDAGFLGQVEEEGEPPFPLYAAEVQLSAFLPLPEVSPVEVPSRFPGIAMDLTLTHALEVSWAELSAAVQAAEVPDLAAFGLKDRYRGSGVPKGAVNSTLYFRYNAADKSLTQEEVNARHQALTAELEGRFGFAEGGAAS